jgi:hypothetical protein
MLHPTRVSLSASGVTLQAAQPLCMVQEQYLRVESFTV